MVWNGVEEKLHGPLDKGQREMGNHHMWLLQKWAWVRVLDLKEKRVKEGFTVTTASLARVVSGFSENTS